MSRRRVTENTIPFHQVALNAAIARGIRLRQERALEQCRFAQQPLDLADYIVPQGPLYSAVQRILLTGTTPTVGSVLSILHQHHSSSAMRKTRHTSPPAEGGGGGGGASGSSGGPKPPRTSGSKRTGRGSADFRPLNRTSTATSSSSAGSSTSILSSLSSSAASTTTTTPQRRQRRRKRRPAAGCWRAAGHSDGTKEARRRARKASSSPADARWTDDSRSESPEHSNEGALCLKDWLETVGDIFSKHK
ncbi:AGAP011714-PA-like protein [Anopheles sinensis]|uniref:AGAP011714-PA-like protein n=1 Tax=Anopheles sinensis TaxID=74873 RepID=A0A084VGF9_ANOSI|nr:AGAP011714-PA-like protein [Anopheles sinensis]